MARVECYSGYTYPENPRAFYVMDQKILVEAILNRWRLPEGWRFWVLGSDDARYEIEYHEALDSWTVRPL